MNRDEADGSRGSFYREPRISISLNGMIRRFYFQQLGYRRRNEGDHFMELHTIGIDLGKTIFHLVGSLHLRPNP